MKKPTFDTWDRNDREFLYLAIEKTGLTQAEAARRIGLDVRTLRKYLNGTRECPFHVAAMLYLLAN